MKKLLIVLVACILGACATDRTVHISEAQVQEMLNKKLALPISVLKIFDVNLSNSLVKFDKTTGRMNTTLDTNMSSQLLDKTLAGKLGISGKLRFDAPTQSIVLDDPKIEQLTLDGAGGKYNDLLNALAKTVGGEMLNGITLYTVKPEDLKYGGTSYSPKDMVVTDNGLQLTLSPIR
ncbi:MAG: DUF1439 domain-containing protein [Methylophilaceae bacterium]